MLAPEAGTSRHNQPKRTLINMHGHLCCVVLPRWPLYACIHLPSLCLVLVVYTSTDVSPYLYAYVYAYIYIRECILMCITDIYGMVSLLTGPHVLERRSESEG